MASQHKEKLRGIRGIDDKLWADFNTAANAVGKDRSALCRQFIEWFTDRPGAVRPDRPVPAEPNAAGETATCEEQSE
ncbi:hypothetical protein ACFZB6_31190 [Streptomyces syringium]|uniref:hypothetical protein n=1 Tax=Streptomyces syringium TaxID=76729 RepID=UPI0036F0DD19